MSHTLDMEKAQCLLFNRVQNKDPEGRDDFLMTKTPQRLAEVRPEPLCLRALESVVSYFMVHALLVTDNGVRTQKKKSPLISDTNKRKNAKEGLLIWKLLWHFLECLITKQSYGFY